MESTMKYLSSDLGFGDFAEVLIVNQSSTYLVTL